MQPVQVVGGPARRPSALDRARAAQERAAAQAAQAGGATGASPQTAAEKAAAAKAAAAAAAERAANAKAAAEAARNKAANAKAAAESKRAAAAPASAAPLTKQASTSAATASTSKSPAAAASSSTSHIMDAQGNMLEVFMVVAPAGPLGIGLTSSAKTGYVQVGDVQKGSMAAQKGVTVGCSLISVNGKETKGLTTKEVTGLLREAGQKGEPRRLEFARQPKPPDSIVSTAKAR